MAKGDIKTWLEEQGLYAVRHYYSGSTEIRRTSDNKLMALIPIIESEAVPYPEGVKEVIASKLNDTANQKTA